MSALGQALTPLDCPGSPAFVEALRQRCAAASLPVPEPLEALASVAAVSPYLATLMTSDPAALGEVLAAPLEATVERACEVVADGDLAAAGVRLRSAKRRVALAVALADLCAGASVATVTGALSDFADAALRSALGCVLADAAQRGKIREADVAASGMIVLALGKLGGRELNYSSDVDLVVLFDPERGAAIGLDHGEAVRITRRLTQLMSERTADGYVFRVDLRLRPDPGSTPVAVTTRAAIAYMQREARAWERQAMIKARQVAGDPIAGRSYLRAVSPSIWRSVYDFGAIEDTFQMREQLALVKGVGDVTVPGHNVKLGRGGIREVEFVVQTLQRVIGGRDRSLRGRQTIAMLNQLAACGWVDVATRDTLCAAYDRLRKVEHRLQMVTDEQTHTLPVRAADLARIATMLREPDFEPVMRATLEAVHTIFLSLPRLADRANPLLVAFDPQEGEAEVGAEIEAAFERWLEGTYQSLKTEQARTLLGSIREELGRQIAASPDPAGALAGFDGFLARLPSGVEALRRLELHRELIPALVLIVAAAPRVAEQLARRAHLLDVLIDPAFFGQLPGPDQLARQLEEALGGAPDYEGKLDAMRVFGQEQALLIEVRVLTGSLAGRAAAEATTHLAEVLSARALTLAQDEFARRHGHLKGGACCLLALGKLGSAEMTATSDLDLVFLYDAAPDAGESDGAKGLSPGHYYTRLAQRFIAALAAPTARGSLYEVDLRLRPSGRAGPIATHIRSFERYHEESAWVWEHMALTRARVVAGDEALGARALEAIRAALVRPRDPQALAGEVAAMRERIEEHGTEDGLKRAVGGLIDIEFVAQFLCLREGIVIDSTDTRRILRTLQTAGALTADDLETLLGALILMQKLSQIFAVTGGPSPLEQAPVALRPLLTRAGEAPDLAFLKADLEARREAVREVFARVVCRSPQPASAGAVAASR